MSTCYDQPLLPPDAPCPMSDLILFNKPYGVLCQFSSADGRPTLKDFLPQRDIYAAGRLDTDSEGLLILTADGMVQHRIADPRHKLPKVYLAQVEGEASDADLEPLRVGIELNDGPTRPAEAGVIAAPDWLWDRTPPIRHRKLIPTSWLRLTLYEGRNRQVRRMTAAIGFPTLRLIRYAVGPWTLDGLAPGMWQAVPTPGDWTERAAKMRQPRSTYRQRRR